MPAPAPRPTRIWDLPTRLFHWALMLTVTGSVLTGLKGGDAMALHFKLGQAALALLAFRLVWGVVGGRWSRFGSARLSPSQLRAYLRGEGVQAGHSPMGWLSVLVLVLILGAQIGTGLVSNDDIAFAGPLSHLVANDTVTAATAYHRHWGKLLLLAWVALHLAALLWYSLRGRGLVGAMVHGDQALDPPPPASRDDLLTRLVAAAVLAACVALSAWVFSLAPAGF